MIIITVPFHFPNFLPRYKHITSKQHSYVQGPLQECITNHNQNQKAEQALETSLKFNQWGAGRVARLAECAAKGTEYVRAIVFPAREASPKHVSPLATL